MKKVCLFLVLLTLVNSAFAQKKVILHYKFIQHINGVTSASLLEQYYSNGRSLELPLINENFKSDTTYKDSSKRIKLMLKGDEKRPPFTLKMPESESLVYAERIGFKSTLLAVDTLNNIKWTISEKTKKIKGELCIMATTYFRGRHYVAWFKKDKEIQAGPWKFGGLPGIIYEVKDDDEQFSYLLDSLEDVDEFSVKLKIPDAYNSEAMITHSEFISAWKNYRKDAEKDNDKITVGFGTTKVFIVPIKELY